MQAIENLRSKMQTAGIAACIIPQNDPHASAYIAEHWQALQYFSGFTGSAGTLVVLPREAGLWTDSRYFLQADEELAGTDICLFRSGEKDVPTIYDFLVEKLPENSLVSMNGLLFSVSEIECAEAVFNRKNIRIDIQTDLITQAWDNRPPMPFSNIFIHNIKYAGKTTSEKIQTVRQQIQENNCCALVLNTPEEIAWLLNLRAADVKHNPLFIAYLVITSNESILFVDKNKLNEEVKIYLQANRIRVENYQAIIEKTASVLGKGKTWIDPEAMNYALYKGIKTETFRATSPVILLKSIKNETEINGIHRAMIKDGVALTQFWQWLEIALAMDEKPTELSLAEKLRSLRAKQEDFFDESFAPIVAYGKHGAIVHYHATPESNARLLPDNLLLLDSGAQYLHGTTDITRTFALGVPTNEQKRHYTLVLKGHIALVQTTFPTGTCGYQLDVLARQFLWREGLNYGHGTGHGAGYFLCVHEPPQNISPRANQTPLQAGMAVSNEPGIYFENKYGIRLENLMLVVESEINGFLFFETLSLFPFDNKLIDFDLLTEEETAWLRHYNQRVLERLSPYLTQESSLWLEEKCNLHFGS